MLRDQKSLGAGLAFILLGIALLLYGYSTLNTGTARNMGPGYFPRLISIFLIVIGAAVILTAKTPSKIQLPNWPLRQIALVLIAILVFASSLKYIGFLGAAFAMSFISAKARKETGFLQAVLIAAGVTLFCTVIFRFGLGIPFQLY